jgi:hypothetical protein
MRQYITVAASAHTVAQAHTAPCSASSQIANEMLHTCTEKLKATAVRNSASYSVKVHDASIQAFNLQRSNPGNYLRGLGCGSLHIKHSVALLELGVWGRQTSKMHTVGEYDVSRLGLMHSPSSGRPIIVHQLASPLTWPIRKPSGQCKTALLGIIGWQHCARKESVAGCLTPDGSPENAFSWGCCSQLS